MKRTIIYVFGPKRLAHLYQSNQELPHDETSWLKIGLTTTVDDNADKWDVAYNRITQEPRTGISETCLLLDVFEYPFLDGKPDDDVRRLMTDDVYKLSNSKANNKLVQNQLYEIRAGQEFVYGGSRAHVMAAIAKFERDLMLEFYRDKQDLYPKLVEMINGNKSDAVDDSDDTTATSQKQNKIQTNDLWDKVKDRLPDYIKEKSNHPKDKNYIYINTKRSDCKWYILTCNLKRLMTSVALETYDGGEKVRDSIENYIEDNDIRGKISDLEKPMQGIKNPQKYSWAIRGEYAGEEQDVINWFVENTIKMFDIFEPKTT